MLEVTPTNNVLAFFVSDDVIMTKTYLLFPIESFHINAPDDICLQVPLCALAHICHMCQSSMSLISALGQVRFVLSLILVYICAVVCVACFLHLRLCTCVVVCLCVHWCVVVCLLMLYVVCQSSMRRISALGRCDEISILFSFPFSFIGSKDDLEAHMKECVNVRAMPLVRAIARQARAMAVFCAGKEKQTPTSEKGLSVTFS